VLALSQMFSVETSGKIILSIYIILLPISVFYLVHAWNQRNVVIGFFGFLFVFNWFFGMGFINFVLSIPFSLFSLGYWWKHKENSTWESRLILALLLLLVYLSHPFGYCFLLVILAVLLIYCRLRGKAVISDSLAALPSLALLAMVLVRDLPNSREVSGLLGLLYRSLEDKLEFAFNKSLPYLTSYRIGPERYVLYAAALVAVVLFLRQLLRREAFNLGAILIVASMFVLYIVLPEHLILPDIKHIASRALIFFLLLALLLVNAPDHVISRLAVGWSLFGLSCVLFISMFFSYQNIDRQLSDINTAFKHIPENSRLATWVDLNASKYGRIYPVAMFGGYYYINRAGDNIPSLANFGGPLRALQFKDQSEREKTIEQVLSESCRRLYENEYFIMVPYSARIKERLVEIHDECRRSGPVGNINIYQRYKVRDGDNHGSHPEHTDNFKRLYKKGFKEDYDYLLVFAGDNESGLLDGNHQLVYSRGKIHVWRRL
jgi:hypothetical protein